MPVAGKNLNENLQYLMRLHGNLSVTELAEQTDIPQPTLHHILFGLTKNPRRKALEALATFFSISIPQLMGEVSLPKFIPGHIEENLKIKMLPVIPWDMTKHWPNQKTEFMPERVIITDKELSPDSFAIVLEDDHYEPIFPKGSILIFDPQKKLKNKDFILVYLHEAEKVVFNRLFIDGSEQYIRIDEDDGDARLKKLKQDKDHIVGSVVEARLQFDLD